MSAKTPKSETIAIPCALTPQAREIWDKLAPELAKTKRLGKSSAIAFAGLCSMLVAWLKLSKEAETADSSILINAGKTTSPNPIYKNLRDLDSMVQRWAKQFGLTPAALKGLATADIDEDEAAFAAEFD